MTGTGTATAAVRDGCLGIFNVLTKPNLPGLLSVIKILLRELNNILNKSNTTLSIHNCNSLTPYKILQVIKT